MRAYYLTLRNKAQSVWLLISAQLKTIIKACAKLETSTKTSAKLNTKPPF